MKTTGYFDHKVRLERPYATEEMVAQVIAEPEFTEVQEDGRLRSWRKLEALGGKYLRVVTLEDGATLHNAFIDRNMTRRNR